MPDFPAIEPSHRRPSVVGAIVLTLVFFVFYAMNSSHTVALNHGDAALLQVVGAMGGIPHQPYPLWCVLSNAAVLVPVGEPAFRVTLLTNLCAALTVGILFLIIMGYTNEYVISTAAAAAFGLSHSFWHNAVMVEVYAVNALLLVIFIYCLFRWIATSSLSYWFLSLLLLGFLLSHHQLNLALFPPLLFVLYWRRHEVRRMMSPGLVFASAGVLILPFTLLVYTYLMDGNPHAMNWLDRYGRYLYAYGHPDAKGFDGFFERVRFQMWAGRYGAVVATPMELASRFYYWLRHLLSLEFPFVGTLLIMVGAVSLWRRDRRLATFWVVFCISYLFLAINGPRGSGLAHTYSIPIYLVCAVCLAQGLLAVKKATSGRRTTSWVITWALAALVVALPYARHLTGSVFARVLVSDDTASMAGRQTGRFWHLKASNDNGRIYGQSIREHVPAGSLVFAGWAEGNVLFYYKYVQKTLEDIDVHYIVSFEFVEQIVRDTRPRAVYFTADPKDPRLGVEEVLTIEPGRQLFKIKDSVIAGWIEG